MKYRNFRIKEYSVFAGSFLLLNGHLKSEVIYTDINPDIMLQLDNETAAIDIDNNGTVDFAFLKTSVKSFIYYTEYGLTFSASQNAIFAGPNYIFNEIVCPYFSQSGYIKYYALALNNNQLIGETLTFQNYGYQLLVRKITGVSGGGVWASSGNWWPVVEDHYLGIHFKSGSDFHYGWIRCTVDSAESIIIKDYAYEAEPEHAILAGDTVSYVGIEPINTFTATVYAFNQSIFINIPHIKEDCSIHIYDITGREIYTAPVSDHNTQIHLDKAVGIYLVEVISGNDKMAKSVVLN